MFETINQHVEDELEVKGRLTKGKLSWALCFWKESFFYANISENVVSTGLGTENTYKKSYFCAVNSKLREACKTTKVRI